MHAATVAGTAIGVAITHAPTAAALVKTPAYAVIPPTALLTFVFVKFFLAAFTAERLALLLLAPPFTAIISFCSILYYPPMTSCQEGLNKYLVCMAGFRICLPSYP